MGPKERESEKWILPDVTRHIITEWEAEGQPDIWPYKLFDSVRGVWVEVDSVEELQAVSMESETPIQVNSK